MGFLSIAALEVINILWYSCKYFAQKAPVAQLDRAVPS